MKIYKILILVLVGLFSIGLAFAEGQSECSKRVEEQFKELNATMSSYAGTSTYKKMQDQAMYCFNSGRCGKIDVMLGTQEMMVDEIVVGIQREKLARLKSFLAEQAKKQNPNDVCGLANSFPALITDIKSLNDKQMDRFGYLAQRSFGTPSVETKSSQ